MYDTFIPLQPCSPAPTTPASPSSIPSRFAIDAAATATARNARRLLRSRRRPGRTLSPGPDTPLWNELANECRTYLVRYGDKARLARILRRPSPTRASTPGGTLRLPRRRAHASTSPLARPPTPRPRNPLTSSPRTLTGATSRRRPLRIASSKCHIMDDTLPNRAARLRAFQRTWPPFP